MRVHDLNEELLNELNMDDVKRGAKKVVDGAKEAVLSIAKVAKDEYNDNVIAFGKLIKHFTGRKEMTKEDFKKAVDQIFKDNSKLLIMGFIAALPGSAVALPVVLNIAKKFNVNLVPSKTFA